jgi:ubiquinone/menaquinone biosynthesis C-methylase UbiE
VRILDLAAGNGPIARLAVQSARRRQAALHVTAVDLADIDPATNAPDAETLSAIHFIGGVPLEALPLESGSFDVVVSQFGFEYGDEAKASAEAARVLKPGGLLRLVIHAHDGEYCRDAAVRADRLHFALQEQEFLRLVRRVARGHALGLPTQPAAMEQLHAAYARTERLRASPPADDTALFYVEAIANLWNARERYEPAAVLQSIEAGLARAGSVLLRQLALLAAARSSEQIEALRARLAALGVTTAPAEALADDTGSQIAWLLDGKK